MDQLKFIALDRDDLDVVSAHLQDATVKVGDMLWRPAEKRMVLGLNRFDWTSANGSANGSDRGFRRTRSALRFDRVLGCKCKCVDPTCKQDVLNLLAVEFEETNAPAGAVILHFSGGGQLRLEVECLECELADLGPSWATEFCPGHAIELDEHRLEG